jgi:hypothetical protein
MKETIATGTLVRFLSVSIFVVVVVVVFSFRLSFVFTFDTFSFWSWAVAPNRLVQNLFVVPWWMENDTATLFHNNYKNMGRECKRRDVSCCFCVGTTRLKLADVRVPSSRTCSSFGVCSVCYWGTCTLHYSGGILFFIWRMLSLLWDVIYRYRWRRSGTIELSAHRQNCTTKRRSVSSVSLDPQSAPWTQPPLRQRFDPTVWSNESH